MELARRAKTVGELKGLNAPAAFIEWAKRLDIDFPPELVSAVEHRGTSIRDWRSDYERLAEERNTLAAELKRLEQEVERTSLSKPLLESERGAMLTILAAMAIKGYAYVHTGNSTVPQEIVNDAAKIGLTVDVKTVRKHLKAAVKLLPTESPGEP